MSGEVGRPLAITHAVGEALLRCELTFVARAPIDLARARAQHAEYRRVLTSLGAEVRVVDVSPQGPDAVFVEDAVVVLADRAVLTRMGVASGFSSAAAAARYSKRSSSRPLRTATKRQISLPAAPAFAPLPVSAV